MIHHSQYVGILLVLTCIACSTAGNVRAAGYSEFVPPAPEGQWNLSCFRSPGWGPDPNSGVPGNSKLWGHTLRVESRDFAFVSTRRAVAELYNEPAPYWAGRSFLWFRSGEVEVPHSIWVSCQEEGAAPQEEDLGVYPYGPYYTSRISDERVACKMLGWAGRRDKPANMPAYYRWPKVRLTWYHLLDAGSRTGVIRVAALNTSGKQLTDVDVKLIFHLGPEFGQFWTRELGSSSWSQTLDPQGPAQGLAAVAEGMESGIAIMDLGGDAIEVTPGSPMHSSRAGRSVTIHFRAKALEAGETLTGRAFVAGLTGKSPRLPAGLAVPNDDLENLSYTEEPSPLRFVGGEADPEARPFSLAEWLADLKRPKIRGVTQTDGSPQVAKPWIERYKGAHQNALVMHFGFKPDDNLVAYAKERGLQLALTAGTAEPLKALPRSAQPDGYGIDVDAPLWSHWTNPSRFREKFGYDITKANREALVRYYSWLFAEYWRQDGEKNRQIVPDAVSWFYGQLQYQADRFPLNTDEMTRVYCEELAKVPDIHLLYFYYGIDHGNIENQIRIGKSAGLKNLYIMPMSYFCAQPGQITGNLAAAQRGGADGAFLFTADWATDWQGCEWTLASQTSFPTPDLPAFMLTWDLQGLIDRIREAEDVRVELGDRSGISPTCAEGANALEFVLMKRARPDAPPRKEALTIFVGLPTGEDAVAAKVERTLAKCRAAGLDEDKGYILPFENGIWVGGATSEANERAVGLMLEVARMASFGGESVPFPRQESDGIFYP